MVYVERKHYFLVYEQFIKLSEQVPVSLSILSLWLALSGWESEGEIKCINY